jgi:hypothetical protein
MFQPLYDDSLRQLQMRFPTSRLDVPAVYAERSGELRGKRYTMDNAAYSTDKLRKVRLSRITAEDSYILNMMAFPQPVYDLPIFGAELLAFRGAPHLVVIDHQPLWKDDPDYARRYIAPLAPLHARFAHLPTRDRSLPPWTEAFFSPYTFYARPYLSDLPEIEACFRAYWTAYLDQVAQAEPQPAAQARILARQAEYCQNHTENEQGETMLQKLFGFAWCAAFVHDFLFDVHLEAQP